MLKLKMDLLVKTNSYCLLEGETTKGEKKQESNFPDLQDIKEEELRKSQVQINKENQNQNLQYPKFN